MTRLDQQYAVYHQRSGAKCSAFWVPASSWETLLTLLALQSVEGPNLPTLIHLHRCSRIIKGRKLFGDFFFFSLGNFFWLSGSHHFPCYLQHFGAGNCHFHGMCNGFEFEPLIFHCIFHGICNSLQHVLSIFHALCSIFELESAFPPYVQHFTATFLTVLAGFWSWRLTFQQLFVVTVTVVGVGVVVVGGVVVGGGGGRVVAVVVAVVSVNVSVVSVVSVVLVLC